MMSKFWHSGFIFDMKEQPYGMPHTKLVAISNYTEALWIHGTTRIRDNYVAQVPPFPDVFIIHLRNTINESSDFRHFENRTLQLNGKNVILSKCTREKKVNRYN